MSAVRSLAQARKKITSLQASTKRAREKAGELMENVMTTAVTSGSAMALGFIDGRSGEPDGVKIAGVPLDLGVGLGTHMLALFGVGRGMDSHLRSVGNGALSGYTHRLGFQLGQESRAGGGDLLGRGVSSSLNPAASAYNQAMAGEGITEEDLAELAV